MVSRLNERYVETYEFSFQQNGKSIKLKKRTKKDLINFKRNANYFLDYD